MVRLYAPSKNRVTQAWGAEFYNFDNKYYPNGFYRTRFGWYGHNGIDYSFGPDRNVYAAGDGVVTFADWGNGHPWVSEGGIVTMIDHGPFYSVYAHQYENNKVRVGQRVKAGQVIGTIGGTGMVAGPHLHFELIPKNPNMGNGWYGRISPLPYMVSTKPKKVLLASIKKPAPAKAKDDDMPTRKNFKRTADTKLRKGKWEYLRVDNRTVNNVSLLSGKGGALLLDVSTDLYITGVPAGQEVQLRYVLDSHDKKGKKTKTSSAWVREVFGSGGALMASIHDKITVPKGDHRLRLQIKTFSDNVVVTQNDTIIDYWKA